MLCIDIKNKIVCKIHYLYTFLPLFNPSFYRAPINIQYHKNLVIPIPSGKKGRSLNPPFVIEICFTSERWKISVQVVDFFVFLLQISSLQMSKKINFYSVKNNNNSNGENATGLEIRKHSILLSFFPYCFGFHYCFVDSFLNTSI